MLGIILGDLVDEEKAPKLKLPISYGVILQGTIEGMGAEAAGLRGNDVIVSMNQQELKSYQDFAPAFRDCKAGDEVEVIFYRDGEKHTVPMELSRRQIPETPANAIELGEAAAKVYAEVAEERKALFEGITEEEASARPEPEEWSAKEILVHMLYSERWLHLAIASLLSGQRVGGFANQLELIAALADSYTLEELLSELKRSEQVTVASIKALPEDFVTDKRRFLGFAYSQTGQGFALHTRSHFDQIKAAIEAARAS
jgi:membrane-associated protease RseP (regulator of RpoE activity)